MNPAGRASTLPEGHSRVRIGPVPVDCVTFDEALDDIASRIGSGRGGSVFTPNVDHVVLASSDARFRRAYEAVDLSLADGMPVVWASRLYGRGVPEKVSGSDLVPRLVARAEREGWRLFLLGGAEGVAPRAAQRLKERHPRLRVVGTTAPRIDMDGPRASRAAVIATVRAAAPDLVLVALGAPKQELWIAESGPSLRPAILVGVGASLDFVAGTAKRAPEWMSSNGLEWLYRLAHEPRRLAGRYLVRDLLFLRIFWHDLRSVRPVTHEVRR
jgi:N-acetylglucosaminyldiphosphoundecaprenol N-acetyl-beta-D-mannosaminyltransferase